MLSRRQEDNRMKKMASLIEMGHLTRLPSQISTNIVNQTPSSERTGFSSVGKCLGTLRVLPICHRKTKLSIPNSAPQTLSGPGHCPESYRRSERGHYLPNFGPESWPTIFARGLKWGAVHAMPGKPSLGARAGTRTANSGWEGVGDRESRLSAAECCRRHSTLRIGSARNWH